MSISINPIFPVIAAQGVAPDAALQPGTVIDAQVQKNSRQRSGSHRDCQSDHRGVVRNSARGRPDPATCGVADGAGPEAFSCGAKRVAKSGCRCHAGYSGANRHGDADAGGRGRCYCGTGGRGGRVICKIGADCAGSSFRIGRGADRRDTARQPVTALRQSAGGFRIGQVAAAGATDRGPAVGFASRSRSEPDRGRHQDRVPELRAFFFEASLAAGLKTAPPATSASAPAQLPDLKAALLVLRQVLSVSVGPPAQCASVGAARFAASAATGHLRRWHQARRLCRPISTHRKSICRRRACRSPRIPTTWRLTRHCFPASPMQGFAPPRPVPP